MAKINFFPSMRNIFKNVNSFGVKYIDPFVVMIIILVIFIS